MCVRMYQLTLTRVHKRVCTYRDVGADAREPVKHRPLDGDATGKRGLEGAAAAQLPGDLGAQQLDDPHPPLLRRAQRVQAPQAALNAVVPHRAAQHHVPAPGTPHTSVGQAPWIVRSVLAKTTSEITNCSMSPIQTDQIHARHHLRWCIF